MSKKLPEYSVEDILQILAKAVIRSSVILDSTETEILENVVNGNCFIVEGEKKGE